MPFPVQALMPDLMPLQTPDAVKDWRQKGKGWQRMRWSDSIANSMDMNLSKLPEMVKDRGAWHAAVLGVTKNWTQCSNWTTKSCHNKIPLTGWQQTFFSLTLLEARNQWSSWQQILFLLRTLFLAFVLHLCYVTACSAVSSYKDRNSSRKRLHPLLILITSLEDPSSKTASLGVKVSTRVAGAGWRQGRIGTQTFNPYQVSCYFLLSEEKWIIWVMARVTIFVCILN